MERKILKTITLIDTSVSMGSELRRSLHGPAAIGTAALLILYTAVILTTKFYSGVRELLHVTGATVLAVGYGFAVFRLLTSAQVRERKYRRFLTKAFSLQSTVTVDIIGFTLSDAGLKADKCIAWMSLGQSRRKLVLRDYKIVVDCTLRCGSCRLDPVNKIFVVDALDSYE